MVIIFEDVMIFPQASIIYSCIFFDEPVDPEDALIFIPVLAELSSMTEQSVHGLIRFLNFAS